MPLGVAEQLSALALVVLMPGQDARLSAGMQESDQSLRDRAMLATRVAFTITDPRQPNNPLVWINPAFTETTGYEFDDIVGRNCRFLQGERTDPQVVAEIRESIQLERPLTTTLLNYRKDGTTFWNEVSISPVRDSGGTVTHFVGVQADVTARVEAQHARNDALAQVALAADRLALLSDFTSRMAMCQRPQQVLELLSDVLIPRVGSWCVLYTYDDAGRLARPHVVHERAGSDLQIRRLVEALERALPVQLTDASPVWSVLRGERRHILISDYDASAGAPAGRSEGDVAALVHGLGARSVAVVPLLARGGILGCVALVTDDSWPPLGEAELALVRDIAVRGGLMLENTQLYARERATAATLQRSLLPRLPKIDGIEIAASYVPAADEAAVGGDWYDVFSLRDGSGVGVAVGDVMGHDYDSAARMGKLSTIVRAYAWPGSDPNTTLTAVDELLEGSGMDFLATCLYAKLTLHGSGATLRYSSAGHPPAIVRGPRGSAVTLDDGRGPMIGVSGLLPAGSRRPPDASVELVRGSTLICFTDGLVDAFADEPDIDAALAKMCRLTGELPAGASPRMIVDELTCAATLRNDDVAVVAIRIV